MPARAEQAAVREPAAPPACAAAPHTAGERALLARPRCLLLDEPSIGLAPKLFQDLLQPIRALQKEHAMSILLIEQNVREAPKKTSDRVAVMKAGAIILEALPGDLSDNARRMELY